MISDLALAGQKKLTNGALARLAISEFSLDSLKDIKSSAKELHGSVVAAVAIHVPAQTATVTHAALPTTTSSDLTRTAIFSDTTFAGLVQGTVTAPPGNTPLGVTFRVYRPAFTPEVGIVKVADRYVAVVSWNRVQDSVSISSPYVGNLTAPRLLGAFAEARYGLLGAPWSVQAGVIVRGLGWQLDAGGMWWLQKGSTPGAFVGLRKEW